MLNNRTTPKEVLVGIRDGRTNPRAYYNVETGTVTHTNSSASGTYINYVSASDIRALANGKYLVFRDGASSSAASGYIVDAVAGDNLMTAATPSGYGFTVVYLG